MRMRQPVRLLVLSTASIAVFLVSCGGPSGPAPAKPGTPAFNWAAAKDAFTKSDYLKANELLVTLSEKENEFTARARPMALVLSYGICQGHWDLTEKLTEASKKTPGAKGARFRSLVNENRAKTTAACIQYIDVARKYMASKPAGEIALEFGFPEGLPDDPPQYQRITKGEMVPEAEILTMTRDVLRRQVMLSAARAVGAGKDAGKARQSFSSGAAKVPAGMFLFALGEGLNNVADIFGLKKLNQPARFLKAAYQAGIEALAQAPDNKETKALITKMKEADKKVQE
jgi:hypothetical protein